MQKLGYKHCDLKLNSSFLSCRQLRQILISRLLRREVIVICGFLLKQSTNKNVVTRASQKKQQNHANLFEISVAQKFDLKLGT